MQKSRRDGGKQGQALSITKISIHTSAPPQKKTTPTPTKKETNYDVFSDHICSRQQMVSDGMQAMLSPTVESKMACLCPRTSKCRYSVHSCQPLLGVNLSPEFVKLYFPSLCRPGSFVFSLMAAAFLIPTSTCGNGRQKQCAKYTCATSNLTSDKIS